MNSIPHKPYGTVYGIRHKGSGRIYVGITIQRVDKRWAYHRWALRSNRHSNPYFQKAWNKYGETDFEFIVLDECDSQESLDQSECQFIESFAGQAYNLKTGGGFGGAPSEESRKRMSAAGKGKPKSEITRQRMSEGNKGVKRAHTAEGKARSLAARIESFQRPEYREKRRKAALGRRHTPEARQKMREVQSERFGITYYLHSPDGATYETRYLHQFCDDHGIKYRNIRNILDGRCKSSKGWTVTVKRGSDP